MIKLLDTRVFIGANIHCKYAAVAARLQFVQPAMPGIASGTGTIPQSSFWRVVAELGLEKPSSDLCRPQLTSGPQQVAAGAVASLAAQIQNLACADVDNYSVERYGKTEALALCAYQIPEVGVEAMQLACAFTLAALEKQSAIAATFSEAVLKQKLASFIQTATRMHLDQTTHTIVSAARTRNIPHFRLSPSSRFVQLGQGVHQHHIFETQSDRTSVTGSKISNNKTVTHHLLRNLGIPTPAQMAVGSFEQAVEAASQMGFPVVVKPSHGMQGIGVTVDINSPAELKAALQKAADAQFGSVLVEKLVPGHTHRLLVVNGKFLAASKRVPAHVNGDGVHSIEQLVNLANQDPRRGAGFNKLEKLVLDTEAGRMLTKQGAERSTIPHLGQFVLLCGTANIQTGSIATDVTGEVHTDVREMAEFIARAFKLDIVGIDYLTHDIARSYRGGGGTVCEVNGCPGLPTQWVDGSDQRSMNARGRVVEAVLDMHFPHGQTGRIPLIAIAGNSGKSEVSRMIAGLLGASGKTTAVVSRDGIFLGDHSIRDDKCSFGASAQAVMLDPRVEAAVMELDAADIAQHGMPFDACDVVAVLDIEDINTHQNGRISNDFLDAVKLATSSATRCVLLNADDAGCTRLAENLTSIPICWVSLNSTSVLLENHLEGMSVTVSGTGTDAGIILTNGAQQTCLGRIGDMPATCAGTAYIREALFAAATAHAIGLPLEQAR